MIFLSINPKTDNVQLFDKYVSQGKNIFALIYMEGCGPCNDTRPEWAKIKNILNKNNEKKNNIKDDETNFMTNEFYEDDNVDDNVVIIDLNYELIENNIKKLKEDINAFPTIINLSENGNKSESYQGERNVDAFIEWINSNKNTKLKGGTNKLKKYKNKKSKKGKKSIKSRKSKKGRKTKKSRKSRKK